MMQVLDILANIATVLAIIANAACVFFAVTAWFRIRQLQRSIDALHHGVAVTTTLTIGEHVKSNFEEVNRLNNLLRDLIEHEQYEDAERMKETIAKAEANAQKSLEYFKSTCGGDIAEVIVTQVKTVRRGGSEED